MVQVVVDWENCRLYEFVVNDHHDSEPGPEWLDYDMEMRDRTRARLQDLLMEPGASFSSVYDFRDGWQHELVVDQIMPIVIVSSYAACTLEARHPETRGNRCPPEWRGPADRGRFPVSAQGSRPQIELLA